MKPTRFVHVAPTDNQSVEALLDLFEAQGTAFESGIRTALTLHNKPFVVQTDFASKPALTPLDDAFTFDTLSGELVVYSPEPVFLVDALLEMALFQRGFQTFIGSYKEWQAIFTIGAWRHVRETLKEEYELDDVHTILQVSLEGDAVERFNVHAFDAMLFLAGQPSVEIVFPPEADAMAVRSYYRLRVLMQTIAYGIGLDDSDVFNRRLGRTLGWVEESIIPDAEYSIFDDLITPDGFDERFFSLGEDD